MRQTTKLLGALALGLTLSACGVVYVSPTVTQETTDAGLKVRVVPMTADTVIDANRSAYNPQTLPAAFDRTVGRPASRSSAQPPAPVFDAPGREGPARLVLPPTPEPSPYMIGVGDTLLFASPGSPTTIEQLSGLLAAQTSRQGFLVQDDGAIAIPDVGRVQVAGMTLAEAEAMLFARLVDAGVDPAFSVEISQFGSQRVSVGGAVGQPTLVPIGLQPVTLTEALVAAGGPQGVTDTLGVIRLYRSGSLYQIPMQDYLGRADLQQLPLVDGDAVFVDSTYDLDAAQAYFTQQIQLAGFRQSARSSALAELQAEIALQRAVIEEERSSFQTQVALDAVERDYVYLTGEIAQQSRIPLPFGRTASLADMLYGEGGGFETAEGNPTQIYVLRGSPDPAAFSGLTAYNLDARNAGNLLLATRFEMRPNDIVFIAEQPVTRWNRAVSLIIPNIVTAGL